MINFGVPLRGGLPPPGISMAKAKIYQFVLSITVGEELVVGHEKR